MYAGRGYAERDVTDGPFVAFDTRPGVSEISQVCAPGYR